MIKINLVAEGRKPVVAQRARATGGRKLPWLSGENAAIWMLGLGVLVGVAAFTVYFMMLRGTIRENDDRIREARKRVEELKDIIRQVEEFERRQADLERKIQVITDLKENQRGPVETMDEISKALPELLWLDRMDMRGDRITLSGRSFNVNAIANFVGNLDKADIFEEPNLRDISQQREVYRFSIDLTRVKRVVAPKPAESPAKPAGP